MSNVLVSTSDEVLGENIVEVLGAVSVERSVWFNNDKEGLVRRLQLEAELIGANAIVSMVYKPAGFFGITERCSGKAVKYE
ncbi:hypothetical protein ES705_29221 [subsurface metagenome]